MIALTTDLLIPVQNEHSLVTMCVNNCIQISIYLYLAGETVSLTKLLPCESTDCR